MSGAEFLKQLEKKREASKKDWNRNVFAVRTNDDISSMIKDYCHLNNISKNHFFKNLLKIFLIINKVNLHKIKSKIRVN